MIPEDQLRFPALTVTLSDGRDAVIRSLATTDGPALRTFYRDVPREDLRFYPHPMVPERAVERAAEAEGPLHVTLVLVLPNEQIGGYAWYRWERPDAERSTFGICIARGCQELRAGRLLMTRLLAIAREVGPPVMDLTVQLANVRAVALYRSMGFQVVREQTCARPPEMGFADEPEYYMEQRIR